MTLNELVGYVQLVNKGEETHGRILDTAMELFWKRSFHAVNTTEISEAAHVNKATLYRHFHSKEQLAVDAVRRGHERTLAYVFDGAFKSSPEPKVRLGEIFARVYATHRDVSGEEQPCPGCPFVNLGVELGTQNSEVLAAVNAAFADFKPYYGRIVADLNDDPARVPLDIDATSEALLQVMNAGMVASKLNDNPREILRAGAIAERLLGLEA